MRWRVVIEKIDSIENNNNNRNIFVTHWLNWLAGSTRKRGAEAVHQDHLGGQVTQNNSRIPRSHWLLRDQCCAVRKHPGVVQNLKQVISRTAPCVTAPGSLANSAST